MKILAAMLLFPALAFAQTTGEREPKTITDHERMNDKVIARREYDANARNLLSRNFREALDRYERGARPELTATWGEFIAADGTPFIALQLALPPGATGDQLTFFGMLNDAEGKSIATYNAPIKVQTMSDQLYAERSLIVPLQKSVGTFGLAGRGEIIGMTRVAFDPENLAAAEPAISRLIVSRDVYLLPTAQGPFEPFAFGGIKVVPTPGASFRKSDKVWLFTELRNPKVAADGSPRIAAKLTVDGPKKIDGSPEPAEATPLKGMPGHYGIGNPIDISSLPAGDYVLHVTITDTLAKQSFRRDAEIHIRD